MALAERLTYTFRLMFRTAVHRRALLQAQHAQGEHPKFHMHMWPCPLRTAAYNDPLPS